LLYDGSVFLKLYTWHCSKLDC